MTNLPSPPSPKKHDSWLFSRTGIVTICAVLILGFLIFTGHSAHLLGALPYLLLLCCPLMMLFMHGGHNDGNNKETAQDTEDNSHAQHHHHGSN